MRRRRTFWCGMAAVVTALLGLSLGGCAGRAGSGAAGSRGALAVVLAPTTAGTRLVVVDVAAFRVVRTIRLRSLVTDIALDETTGQVVAAQTGGIGERADRAVSLTDPRTGRVRYVKLAVPDPVNVVCARGVAYVLHSVVTSTGLVCSVVDIGREAVVKTARAPDGPGIWASSPEGIWTVRVDGTDWSAVRLDSGTLGVSTVTSCGVRASGVAEAATGTLLLGSLKGRDRSALAVLRSDGSVARTAEIPGLRYPARLATPVGRSLIVGDWAGQSPEPGALAVLDADTLAQQRTLRVPGGPCAFAAHGSSVLVVERTTGALLEIEPSTGKQLRSVTLGTGELLVSDVVIVPALR